MFINSDTNLASAPLLEALSKLAADGRLRMPRIDATFGLPDVAEGFAHSASGHTVGKVSILVRNASEALDGGGRAPPQPPRRGDERGARRRD